MKKIISVLFCMLLLAGCGSKDYGKLLIGTFSWTSSKGEEVIMSFDGERYYTLNPDVALTFAPYELDGNKLGFEEEQYEVDFNKNDDLLLTLDQEYEPVEMKRMPETYLQEKFDEMSLRKKLTGYWKWVSLDGTDGYFNFDSENEFLAYTGFEGTEKAYWAKYFVLVDEDSNKIFMSLEDGRVLLEWKDCIFRDMNHVKIANWECTRIHSSEVKEEKIR